MRVAKPISLFLPAKVADTVPDVRDRENYFYLIHNILLQPTIDRRIEENDGFVSINREKFKFITGCNPDKYIKFFQNDEILECDNVAVAGRKSYHYRLRQGVMNGAYSKYDINSTSPLFERIIKRQRVKKANYNRLEPHLRKMQKEFMDLSFDVERAVEWVENNATGEKKLSYLISIQNMIDGRFRYFGRNTTNNRLDTNLTNMKTELRKFIIGDFVQIDLKNSQPFFLLVFLQKMEKNYKLIFSNISKNNQSLKSIPLCCNITFYYVSEVFGIKTVKHLSKIHQKQEIPNLMKFRNAILNGKFYEVFQESSGNGMTREEAKLATLKVFYSQNEMYTYHKRFVPYEVEKGVFRQVFPGVYDAIEILKWKSNSDFANFLTRMESALFIDTVAKELCEKGIIPLTIHDAVIVPAGKKNEALELMKGVFERETGFIPMFDVEPIK